MKFHCHRPSLAAAFGIVGGVVPTRTPREILQNVRLSADGDTARLSGTDSEVAISYKLTGIETLQPGEILLPVHRVNSILRELTSDHLTIELDEQQVVLTSGQSEFRLASVDPQEFPSIGDFEEEDYFDIPVTGLKEAVRRTIFAVDPETTRYALGGVMIEPSEHGLTFAATDSRRLAVYELACERRGQPASDRGAVMPSKALGLLERSLGGLEQEERAQLALRGNDVIAHCGSATILARLVEGRFPNYRQVIPAESPISIPMVVSEFLPAIKQARILTSDESRGVDFTFEEGTLTLQSQAGSEGTSKIAMPIDYRGDRLAITVDPKFFGEILRVLEPATTFDLNLTDSDTQIVMRVGTGYTYVIMPLSRDRR